MSDELDFLNDLPKGPPPLRPVTRKTTTEKLIKPLLAVIGLLCLILVVVLVQQRSSVPITTANGTVGASASTAYDTTQMTKEEWREKYKQLKSSYFDKSGNGLQVPKAALFKTFGDPVRTQTLNGNHYWYWNCKDGVIQVVDLVYNVNTNNGGYLEINDY